MTNDALLNILNNLCNEARNCAHGTFGLVDISRETIDESAWRASLAFSRSSADRLLRSMDDLRELIAGAPAACERLEDFDLVLALGRTIDLTNLAFQEASTRIRLNSEAGPVILRQDRQAVEQVLTRITNAISMLSEAGEFQVVTDPRGTGNGVSFAIAPPESTLAIQLADWLNADPEQIRFRDTAGVPFGLAVMVAGRRLRALGGFAELVHEFPEQAWVVIHLRSYPEGIDGQDGPAGGRKPQPDALNILLTEDCDDSYAISKILLRNENLWRARNGKEALEIVKKQTFDLAFMDVHMPGMDGYTTIRAIRDWETETSNARMPIVVLSSDDLETQRRCAAQSGCSGFLKKPMRSGDLVPLLDRLKATRSLAS